MLKISVKNSAGKDLKEINLSPAVFGLPANDRLLHQVYVALSGNTRKAIAHTKDRSERAGSGIKPWRQKGTGRARVGSVRSPIWRKGGVTFGPTKDRNFSRNTNKKMRQKAVMIALSEKVRAGKMLVLDTLLFSDRKTKSVAEVLRNLSITRKSLTLGLTSAEETTARISRNIPKVTPIRAENMSVLELLNHEYLLLSPEGIQSLEQRFAHYGKTGKKEASAVKTEAKKTVSKTTPKKSTAK